MSLRWIVVCLMIPALLAGSWGLYTYQPHEDTPEDVLTPALRQLAQEPAEAVEIMTREVTLFIADSMSGTLVRKIREIETREDMNEEISQTIAFLIEPEEGLRNEAIPEGTQLINVFVTRAGIVYVNFTRHLQDHHVGGLSAELATVTSLVNTLLSNFKDVHHVQILVEGAEIETLAGHVDCRKPFSKLLLID